MSYKLRLTLLFILTYTLVCVPVFSEDKPQEPSAEANETRVATIKLNYMPPLRMLEFLGVCSESGVAVMEWQSDQIIHSVDVRSNMAANLLVVTGEKKDVDFVEALISEADIPPRQIEIEIRIVEVSKSKARNIGIDWDGVIQRSQPRLTWRHNNDKREDHRKTESRSSWDKNYSEIKSTKEGFEFRAAADISQLIRILDESGAATIRTAPRILTLNNNRATILDGQRVTYITRYSSYTNLFETDSMDAGLTMTVLPSLGESGYITLDIDAELTTLVKSISDSPVKDGQIIQNTVIVMDGESVLLGGLSRTVEETRSKRFPILGHILPFLFSREVTIRDEVERFIILTPRVVDFSTALNEKTREAIHKQ